METEQGKVVCVTGGSGYIAAWLTKLLLERGYTVRATVRNLNDARKTQHLLALEGAKERLSLFEADLTKDWSFDAAIEGCDGVFHTASPCFYECKDPQVELIDPAVKGTINVLNSCAKCSLVKRVVVTSSTATMMLDPGRRLPGAIVDETWFSDTQFCKDLKLWYIVSKILAEEAALKFAKEKGVDVVVMHPGMVIGPLLQPTLNFSTALIATLINDLSSYPDMVIGWIHVEDIALAHILAFEVPSANGRYPLIESTLHVSRVLEMMRELYPALQLPEKSVKGIFPDMIPASKEKMKSLGMDCCIPLQVGLKETIESLKEKKFITI